MVRHWNGTLDMRDKTQRSQFMLLRGYCCLSDSQLGITFERNCISVGRFCGFCNFFSLPYQILEEGGWLVSRRVVLVVVPAGTQQTSDPQSPGRAWLWGMRGPFCLPLLCGNRAPGRWLNRCCLADPACGEVESSNALVREEAWLPFATLGKRGPERPLLGSSTWRIHS